MFYRPHMTPRLSFKPALGPYFGGQILSRDVANNQWSPQSVGDSVLTGSHRLVACSTLPPPFSLSIYPSVNWSFCCCPNKALGGGWPLDGGREAADNTLSANSQFVHFWNWPWTALTHWPLPGGGRNEYRVEGERRASERWGGVGRWGDFFFGFADDGETQCKYFDLVQQKSRR